MMIALRRSPCSLKIITSPVLSLSTWTPPLSTLSKCCRPMSSASNPQVSSSQSESKRISSESSVDPFGLEEVVQSTDKSSVLVQGFYKEESKPEPTPTPVPKPSPEDPDKRSRLNLYDTWLKNRINQNVTERNNADSSESLREAHFGRIRMDSDNQPLPTPTRSSPRNADRFTPNPSPPRRHGNRQSSSSDLNNAETITETITADHSIRMRASDFLKKYRGETGTGSHQDQEESKEIPRHEKVIIEKIIRPAHLSSLDANDPENMASTMEQALTMDSRIVPKEYLLPDFNQITKEDMWSVLKKSVIFQNDFILAINKPPGVPVHSKARSCRHTVIQFLEKFADFAKCERIYPLHRIDKETTGVLLFAKDPKIADIIKSKFANRQIDKLYLGVTKLCPKVREGAIQIPIGEGKIPGTSKYRRVLRPDLRQFGVSATSRSRVEGITNFKVLSSIEHASFCEIRPISGAKHQIRVHFGMGLGCPILGDHKYSHRDKLAPQRLHPHILHKIKLRQSKVRELPLHLHCSSISFTLPEEITKSTEPVHVQAKMPFFMKYTLKRLNLIR